MHNQPYDHAKLKSLFHYVIKAAGARPRFGATKLNKVAWFSDAKSFLLTGHSITGESYIRREHGPVPKHGDQIRAELVSEGAISQSKGRDYDGWRFRALTNPSLHAFSEAELATINYWLRHIDEEHTAQSISEESHDYGWEIAAMYEALPYHAFLTSRIRRPELGEKERHQTRARELGLI